MLLNQSLARVLCIACLILGTNFALAQNSSIAAPATAASAPKVSLPEGITEEMTSQYESLKAERAKYLAAMHKKALKPVDAAV